MHVRTSIRSETEESTFPTIIVAFSYEHAHFLTVNAASGEIFICLSNNGGLVPTFALSPAWQFHSSRFNGICPEIWCAFAFPRSISENLRMMWDKRGERGFLTMAARARKLALKRCDTTQPEMGAGFKKFKRTFENGKRDTDGISDVEPNRKLEQLLF